MHHHLTHSQWVAIAAHRLQYRWRHLHPGQLEDVAGELWRDERLSGLDPERAVDTWLAPVVVARSSNDS